MADIRTDRSGFARRNWGKLTLVGVLLVPAAIFALWTTIALTYTYSSGPRVGYVQKLSRKGWICKTWEGELAMSNVPGQAPELFRYSVRDDAVARAILALEGQRVSIEYDQHKGVPTSCFGETEYFAKAVRRVAEPSFGAPAGPMPTPVPAPPATPAAPAPVPPAPR